MRVEPDSENKLHQRSNLELSETISKMNTAAINLIQLQPDLVHRKLRPRWQLGDLGWGKK